ncbi:unnamed protein product [Brachionus calyciflorus]|uniref:Uncharacterized protein n=1 Tax=Brachionus calyciflorus TaxID=104777 RepID=A0A814I541_9BILA|nr:unnamed protein product [Brachionus calyciflorus]
MEQFKNIILNYYGNVIKQVNQTADKQIEKSTKEIYDEINSLRNSLLQKIKNAQEYNIKHLIKNIKNIPSRNDINLLKEALFDGIFCFFIPRNEQNEYLMVENAPGVLICTSIFLPDSSIRNILHILSYTICIDKVGEKNLNHFLIIYTICKLFYNRAPNSIIDLTDSKTNTLDELILAKNFKLTQDDPFVNLHKVIKIENIISLEFCFFHLDSIPKKWFERFSCLKQLKITGNSVKKLSNNNFSDLKSLQTLELTTSDLQIMEPKVFDGLENLENLIFQTYRIKKLDFTMLKKLKTLKIQASEFLILSKETIQYTNCLEKLEIKNNTLERVEKDAFSSIPKLKELFIQCNHEKLKLCENTFSSLKELQVLYLNGNGIQTIQNGQFDHLNTLKLLDLSNNQFRTINSQIFNPLENLIYLNLNKNKNLVLDFSTINLPNLEYLEFNSNYVPKLTNLINLKGLEINDLENIEENVFDYENNLKYVCLKLNNGEFYNQFNKHHLNGLNNLEYLEMRIKNFNDYDIDKVEEKDKEFIDIINSKLLNFNCEVDYFLSCCLIKTNIGTKVDFIKSILSSHALKETCIVE